MSEDPEVAVLICVTLGMTHTPESVQMTGDCGHELWVSTSGQRMVADSTKSVILKCLPCGFGQLLEDENADVPVKPVPGALDEIQKVMGVAARDQIEARLRDYGLNTKE